MKITDEIANMKNTHLMEWLKQGYGHCQRGSKDWCEGYLNGAHDYILALEAAVADVPEAPAPEAVKEDESLWNFWNAKAQEQAKTIVELRERLAAQTYSSAQETECACCGEITQAERDVLFERDRQKSVEGWDALHDDQYRDRELSRAAACYAIGQNIRYWPWSLDWWKPTDRRRDLVKAGALIIAEIERMDRAAANAEGK